MIHPDPIFLYTLSGKLWRDWGDHFTLAGEMTRDGVRGFVGAFRGYTLTKESVAPDSGIALALENWLERTACEAAHTGCALAQGHDGHHRYGERSWDQEPAGPLLALEVGSRWWFRDREGTWTNEPSRSYLVDIAHRHGFDGFAALYALGKPIWGGWKSVFGQVLPALEETKKAYEAFVGHVQSVPSSGPAPEVEHVTFPTTDSWAISFPDPRGTPEGHCSFCADAPANHWGTGTWKICASADCSAAHHFHEERCSLGSVDTEATRAESLRYGKRWLADKAEEDAKKKPEGSCAFCVAPAEPQHPDCLVAMCGTHERVGWRLTHRIALGGVCDTPELREEVLRYVAESDRALEDGKREARGARTPLDYKGIEHSFLTEQKPPPGEIHLVGITPHYEWP